jgi:hypothetical protein
MAPLARVVAPGLAHHIAQRANRRQQTFFCDNDCESQLELMGSRLREDGQGAAVGGAVDGEIAAVKGEHGQVRSGGRIAFRAEEHLL